MDYFNAMSSSSSAKGKKFTLKTVLVGLRGASSSSQHRPETEIEETLRSEHFNVTKVSLYKCKTLLLFQFLSFYFDSLLYS